VGSIGEWVGRIALLLAGVMLYKYLVLIVVAPIMSPLSERIELSLGQTPVDKPLSLAQWAKDIVRGLHIAMRNITRELLMTAVLLLLSLVPGLAVITTPLIFVVQAYYAGFGNMDYYMERHAGVKTAATYVRRHKWLAIGNGAVFLLLLAIPFVGFLIAPAFGASAATLSILKGPYRLPSKGVG
jgi:CysZ protein